MIKQQSETKDSEPNINPRSVRIWRTITLVLTIILFLVILVSGITITKLYVAYQSTVDDLIDVSIVADTAEGDFARLNQSYDILTDDLSAARTEIVRLKKKVRRMTSSNPMPADEVR